MKICVVSQSVMETIQQENPVATDEFSQIDDLARNVQEMQHRTEIIPRGCSHSCSFPLYIFKFFNKHIHSFINLCSLFLWKFKPPHVSWFCDLQNKANTNRAIYYHTTLYNNLWKCIRRGCFGYLWPFTKQKSEFPLQNKHFACRLGRKIWTHDYHNQC